MQDVELLSQPLWGNENFKYRKKCIYFKSWLAEDIRYVKDLIFSDTFKSDTDWFGIISNKSNILHELYVMKNHVYKHMKKVDLSLAPYVNVKSITYILHNNKLHELKDKRSKFFYEILKDKIKTRSCLECLFKRSWDGK